MPWLFLIAFWFCSHALLGADLGPNLALHQPVEASDDVWGSLSPVSLTDGDPNSFCHPLASTGTRDFYFEIDLGATYQLEEIRIRNRNDGCCPERLTRYRVELYSDASGEAGTLQWTANVRSDGSHSGVGGVDLLTRALNPSSPFVGRFIRVVNASNLAYSPQLAEVEVYGGLPPAIAFFEAERDTLAAGESSQLRWEIRNATGARLDPGGVSLPLAGSLMVQPLQSTTYTLTATNDAGTTTATLLVGVDVTLAPPVITEFLAENKSGLNDEDRDASDWIEIRNPNPYSLELEGFFLTDDPADPAKWGFPQRRLGPHAYLLIFASGKNRQGRTGELHTNFRLDAQGDYLALLNSRGETLQQFPPDYPVTTRFPSQSKDVSYGAGSNGSLGFLRPATPGATNGIAFAGAVADTKFSPDRGFYTTNLLVSITSETPGAIIRYTTDRSEPTVTHGLIYTQPIAINRTTVLRAAAFRADWAPTDVDTHTFLYLSNIISASVMRTNITRNPVYAPKLLPGLLDLPTISLNTPLAINGTTEVKTSMEWITTNSAASFQENCGTKNFGGAFTTFAKKNFRLYFRSEYGTPELRAPLFEPLPGRITPVEKFDQLELRSGSHDMEMRGFYLANIFADDTLLDLKQLNPHGRFVHLMLNGAYWGVYHLRERWNDAMHQSYLGGSRTNYESINGNWNVGGWAEPGTPYDGDGSAWAKVKSLRSNYLAVKPLLDVEQYIDFMIVWMFGGSEDEYRTVGPTLPGSGFKFYLNDADGWFCGTYYCMAGDRTVRGSPGRANGDGPGSLFSMLFRQAHPDYRALLADHIYRALFHDGPLTSNRNIARLNARTKEIERAFLLEAARWNYLSPAEWQSRRDYALTNWLPRRTGEVLTQFRNAGFYPSLVPPVMSRQGGKVAPGFQLQLQTPSAGLVYYTVDGTDPRLPGGALSPGALVGTTPLTINQNTLVKARVRNGTAWSALNSAFFQATNDRIAAGELVICELKPDSLRDGSEFIELQNISTRAVDLSEVQLAGGIRFSFSSGRQTNLAPGQKLLLVRDLLRFQQRYGIEPAVSGVYSGRLSPEGEDLILTGPTNHLGRLSYRTSAPWPSPVTDRTLVLAHPELGADYPAAWRPSALPGGTPGSSDSTTFSGDPSIDADKDGLSAIVEYAFQTSDLDPNSGKDALTILFQGGPEFYLSLRRNLPADDVLIRCEQSHDLVRWEPATLRSSEIADPTTLVEQWSAPVLPAVPTFIRANVLRK